MKRLPPLATLRAFEAAARRLSFKDAADELGLTSTAISHQIRLLEEHCGQSLFRRRPRPLVLTDAGASLFPAIRSGFQIFADGLSSLDARADTRPLRVTTTNAFASRWLVPRLKSWREAHADLALSIIGADRVMSIDADEADLAIRYARSAPPGALREIVRDRFYPMCSPKVLAGHAPILSAGDLADLPLVHFDWFANDPGAPNWTQWQELASTIDPRARDLGNPALSFREESHAIDAVLAGEGVAILSDVVVADELAAGNLVKVLDLPLPGYGFYPLYSADHPRRAAIETFISWLSKPLSGP